MTFVDSYIAESVKSFQIEANPQFIKRSSLKACQKCKDTLLLHKQELKQKDMLIENLDEDIRYLKNKVVYWKRKANIGKDS